MDTSTLPLKYNQSESFKMELIHIQQATIGDGAVNAVNARELHEKLEVKTKFVEWMKRAIDKYGFEDGVDFISFLGKSTGGRPSAEYQVTVDMAKELCMLDDSEKGRQFRKYFIECERKATKQLSTLDQIAIIAKGTLELSETVQKHTADIETLKQDIALNSREKHALKAAVGSKIASFNLKPENVKKIYAAVWKKVKDRFLVSSYMEIPHLQFADALHFVQNISMEDLV